MNPSGALRYHTVWVDPGTGLRASRSWETPTEAAAFCEGLRVGEVQGAHIERVELAAVFEDPHRADWNDDDDWDDDDEDQTG